MTQEPGHRRVFRLSTIRALAAASMVLSVFFTACGADDPAVCTSVNDLKRSFEDLRDIDVRASGALSELQSGLTAIKSDFDQVKADAKSEFASGIDAVEAAYSELRTAVAAATEDPTAVTVQAAGSALVTFGTEVEELIKDIESTC